MKTWLTRICPDISADDVIPQLEREGFRTLDDLRFLEEDDLKGMNVNLCNRRKIIREVALRAQVHPEPCSRTDYVRSSSMKDACFSQVESAAAGDLSEPENVEKCVLECRTTPRRRDEVFRDKNITELQSAVSRLIEALGEDPAREGLLKTPQRVADALLSMTGGYDLDLHTVVNGALFDENHEGMVLVRDIDIFSLCEHHLLPFYGKMHIAYIPNRRVIGLSKLTRIAQMYARRLQVQERLTKQVADALQETLQPLGIAILCDASHGCMVFRGVQSTSSTTVTTCFRGEFRTDELMRQQFFHCVQTSEKGNS